MEGHKDMRWVTEHHIMPDAGQTITNAICRGTASAVTDALFQEKLGTAAFIIGGVNSQNHLVAVNQGPGHPDDQSALWTELRDVMESYPWSTLYARSTTLHYA